MGRRNREKRRTIIRWEDILLARAKRLIRQCPECGGPDTLIVEMTEVEDGKEARFWCYRCGFTHVLRLPQIADEFYAYDRLIMTIEGQTSTSQPRNM